MVLSGSGGHARQGSSSCLGRFRFCVEWPNHRQDKLKLQANPLMTAHLVPLRHLRPTGTERGGARIALCGMMLFERWTWDGGRAVAILDLIAVLGSASEGAGGRHG